MTQFHENIKGILSDVEGFCTALPATNLTPAARAERDKISAGISKLKKQYPQLGAPDDVYDDTAEAGSTSSKDRDSIRIDDTYEDANFSPAAATAASPKSPAPSPGGDSKIKDVPVADLKGAVKNGFLKVKKEKKKAFGGGAKKMFCVVSADNIFYMFPSNTSKKQNAAFPLQGYEAQTAGEATKKECPFQVVCPGKPTYQFIAANKGEMDQWIHVLNKRSNTGGGSTAASPPDDKLYSEPEENRPSQIAKQVSATMNDPEECLYDEAQIPGEKTNATPEIPKKAAAPPPVSESIRRPPPSLPPEVAPDPTPDYNDEIYDDTDVVPETPTMAEEDEELYEDGESAVPPPKKEEVVVVQAAKPAAKPPAPTPATPVTPVARVAPIAPIAPVTAKPDEDPNYSQMYYGLWDCDVDQADELPFKRGDVIEILNRDYDAHSWWVGKLNGRVGIVPKEYLSKAYEIVR